MKPIKSCIVYLVRGTQESVAMLERSLKLVKTNFLPWSPADVIVFHEANFDPAVLSGRTSGIDVHCHLVDFSSVPSALADVPTNRRGYRHMCHFWGNDVFLRPELDDYDYLMRLDDDSYILSPLRFNVFQTMAEGDFKYGYRAVIRDKADVCRDLWPTARNYFKSHHGIVRDFFQIRELNMYYTNFEIVDLKWIRSKPYQDFFRAIDAAEGIWRYRWGDAPIRYIGIQALLDDSKIRQFVELDYLHQSRWRSGYAHRLPWDMLRYYLWLAKVLLKSKIVKSY